MAGAWFSDPLPTSALDCYRFWHQSDDIQSKMGLPEAQKVLEDPITRKWILGGVLVTVYVVLAAYWVIRRARQRKAKQLHDDEMRRFEEMLGGGGPEPKYVGGKTDKYEWTQNESEVEVFVPVPDGTRAKDVQCGIGSTELKLKVHGEWAIKGSLHRKIDTTDCTWQIEKEKTRTVVWISLTKADKADKAPWRGLIQGDPEVDLPKSGPPIIPVNPNDPASMDRISQYLKKNT